MTVGHETQLDIWFQFEGSENQGVQDKILRKIYIIHRCSAQNLTKDNEGNAQGARRDHIGIRKNIIQHGTNSPYFDNRSESTNDSISSAISASVSSTAQLAVMSSTN